MDRKEFKSDDGDLYSIVGPGISKPKQQIFTSEDKGSFATSAMLQYALLSKMNVLHIALNIPDAMSMLEDRDLDKKRLNEFRKGHRALLNPVIYINYGDDGAMLVDGNHRLRIYCEQGRSSFLGWMFSPEEAEKFRVHYYKNEVEMNSEEVLKIIWGLYPHMMGG